MATIQENNGSIHTVILPQVGSRQNLNIVAMGWDTNGDRHREDEKETPSGIKIGVGGGGPSDGINPPS
jgi:hypothetical protein